MSDNATPTLLLTRPRPASERFARACETAFGSRLRTVIAPLMEIVPTVDQIDLTGVDGLIFTSEAGVQVFARLSDRRDLQAWCVGDRTAQTAMDHGMSARSAGGAADDLVGQMITTKPVGRWCHLHGVETRGDVAARLSAAGIATEADVIYAQHPCAPGPTLHAAIGGKSPVIVPLFSPRSATLFAQALADQRPADLRLVAISAATRDALPADLLDRTAVADHPDAPAMIGAISRVISP